VPKKIPKIVKDIQKYTYKKIDYSTQKNISFSQLSMYNQCPRKWALQYVEGNKIFSSTIHTVFGSALHIAIQHYLELMYNTSTVAADNEDIVGLFEESFRNEYKTQYKKNNNTHFSSPEELREFFDDGVKILEFFKKKKGGYFSKKGWHLVGCEVPIVITPNKNFPNIIYQGFLDAVLYHEPSDEFLIIDFKTSTRGWKDEEKKDQNKQFQLILYKKFFSEQFNIPIDKIKINFIILKRKIWEESEYAISRIQEFSPASGKVKVNAASTCLNKFIEEAFNVNGYKEVEHKPIVNNNCKWCPFYKIHLCPATCEE
jgi:hypothetical protein